MTVTTVIFDFGNVLVDWDPANLFAKLIDDPEDRATFLRDVCTPDWNIEVDMGKSVEQATAERVALFPQHAELIKAYYGRWLEMIAGPVPGMIELHGRLRRHGVPLYGLTNFGAETLVWATKHYPVLADFDGVTVSAHEGVCKPDHDIYNILLQRHGLSAETCVFIDDRPENITAAQELGMAGIVFTDADTCKQQLAELMPDLPAEVIHG